MLEARFDCARIGMASLVSAVCAERESEAEEKEVLTDVDAVVFAVDEWSDHSPLGPLVFDNVEEAAAGVEGLEASYPPD